MLFCFVINKIVSYNTRLLSKSFTVFFKFFIFFIPDPFGIANIIKPV